MPRSVGEIVRMLRKRAMLSQEELAERSKLSVSTIRGLEAGRILRPRLASVRQLADTLAPSESERRQLLTAARSEVAEDMAGEFGFGYVLPRQLPAPPAMFTGRGHEVRYLDGIRDSSTVVITAIDGMAGVGKTALALYAGHRMADRYPDGQLFIDLHGFTEAVAPVDPSDALDRLLRGLGVPGERIPAGLEDRAGLWRSILADRRVLVVLDNAATEAQVTPLLPGSPGCQVLVTSRRRLTGLDAVHTVSLEILPVADALALFTLVAGEDRLAGANGELVAEAVELCGRLPLAIRVSAARLRSHRAWSLAELVEPLRDRHQRLAELEDGTRGVAAALEWSTQQLTSEQQRMYRLLGLHPGPDIDRYGAAALADVDPAAAGQVLDQLHGVHLLEETARGRFGFHDLVRAHAARTASMAEPAPAHRAALTRLMDYYRHAASVAMDAAYPHERGRRPRVPASATPAPDLSSSTRAAGWLDVELPNLLASAGQATDQGWPVHLVDLSSILHWHLRTRGRYHDAETLHEQALATARTTGNRPGELAALNSLGWIHRLHGRYQQATDHYEQALILARSIADPIGEADALNGLGWVHRLQGRREQATDHYEQALILARTTDNPLGELDALNGLGRDHRAQGRYQQAADHHQRALRLARATGHRTAELTALAGLGWVYVDQGRYAWAAYHLGRALRLARATGDRVRELDALAALGLVDRTQNRTEQATEHSRQALQVARAIGHRVGELTALTGLAQVHRMQHQYDQATAYYQQLLELAQRIGDRNFQFEAQQGFGRLRHSAGDPKTALVYHQQALAIATDLGQPLDQARAHDGLACAYQALSQAGPARHHWHSALAIIATLKAHRTDDQETNVHTIRAHLAALDQTDGPTAVT